MLNAKFREATRGTMFFKHDVRRECLQGFNGKEQKKKKKCDDLHRKVLL